MVFRGKIVLVRKSGKPLAYCWWLILLPKERVKMKIDLSYKQCCIIKHALQDKNRNLAEEILYRMMSTIVAHESDHRTEIVHGDIPCGKLNRILK